MKQKPFKMAIFYVDYDEEHPVLQIRRYGQPEGPREVPNTPFGAL